MDVAEIGCRIPRDLPILRQYLEGIKEKELYRDSRMDCAGRRKETNALAAQTRPGDLHSRGKHGIHHATPLMRVARCEGPFPDGHELIDQM